jgi:hypothetical protein
VACPGSSKADIFCRECALSDLVAQRKEIKRLEREWEEREIEKDEEERIARQEDARRELDKFERTAQGLEANPGPTSSAGKKRKASELDGAEGNDKVKVKPAKQVYIYVLSTAEIETKQMLMFSLPCRLKLRFGFQVLIRTHLA